VPAGRVEIQWAKMDVREGSALRIEWTERHGPAVVAPEDRGFGTRLIERGVPNDLKGRTELVFDPTGVRCTIDIPLDTTTIESNAVLGDDWTA